MGASDQAFAFTSAQINTNLMQRYFSSACSLFPGNLAPEEGSKLWELNPNNPALFREYSFLIEVKSLHQWAVSIHLFRGGSLDFGYTLELLWLL